MKKSEFKLNTTPESKMLIFVFRLGESTQKIKIPIIGKAIRLFVKVLNFAFIKMGLNTDIPATVLIGDNVNFQHPFGIVIHPRVVIGENAVIRQQVTIGGKSVGRTELIPKIGNNVEIGAGAKIIGDISIGNNVVIGANSVVVKDVPDDDVVAGVPAKSVKRN